jgi:hypothetical protein
VPALLDAGRANLDPALAPRILVDRARGQAQAAISYARAMLPAEVRDDTLRKEVAGTADGPGGVQVCVSRN